MTRARQLADMISDGVIGTTELADDVITPVKLDETGSYTIAQLGVNGTITADGLTVDGAASITTGDNTAQLTLISTDADANDGPLLVLNRNSSSPADNDKVGQIQFLGEDDASNSTIFGSIVNQIKDASNGSEDGRMSFNLISAGSDRTFFNMTHDGTQAEVVVNEDSRDIDFRVESDASANALFVEGSSGNVGIGTASPKRHIHLNGGNETTKIQITNQTTGSSSDGDGFQIGIATNGTALLEQRENADMNFYTNNDLKMTIDSSGNLQVGTTDAGVYDNSAASSASNGHNIRADGKVDHARYTTSTSAAVLGLNRVGSDGYLAEFRKDGAPVGSIGNAGANVYIGSDDVGLLFGGSFATPAIGPRDVDGASDNDAAINLGWSNNRFKDLYLSGGVVGNSNSITISTDDGTTDHVTVDTSGNLLVGTENSTPGIGDTDDGAVLGAAGWGFFSKTYSSADSSSVLYVGRNGTAGKIINIAKDGSTVGSIGYTSAGVGYFAGSSTGVGFGSATVYPTDGSGNLNATVGVKNLGSASYPWKDLHLSGGVVFGSTGGSVTSKTLDDYEEGYHTAAYAPTTSGTITANSSYDQLRYVKIGSLVHVFGIARISSVSSPVGVIHLTLPFTVASLDEESDYQSSTVWWYQTGVGWSADGIRGRTIPNTTNFQINKDASTISGGDELQFGIHYTTSA